MDTEIGAPKQQPPMLEASAPSRRELAWTPIQAMSPTGEEKVCRLCFQSTHETVIAPCHCAGTSMWVHRSCLNQWRSKGMFTNRKAMTHCPSCNFEYEIHCTIDIQEERKKHWRVRWQLLRHSMALCLLVQLFEVALALILATLDQGRVLRHSLRVAEEVVSTDMRRWWTPYLSKDIFYYYAAAVMLSMFLLGVTSALLLVKRHCCSRRARAAPSTQVQAQLLSRATPTYVPSGLCPTDCCDCDLLCWSCDCNCVGPATDSRCCCCRDCCPSRGTGGDCGDCGSCDCGSCGDEAGKILAVICLVLVIFFIIFGLIVAVFLFVKMLNNAAQKYVHVLCLKDVTRRYAVVDLAAQEAAVVPQEAWRLTQDEIRKSMQEEVLEVMGSLMNERRSDGQAEVDAGAQP